MSNRLAKSSNISLPEYAKKDPQLELVDDCHDSEVSHLGPPFEVKTTFGETIGTVFTTIYILTIIAGIIFLEIKY